MATQTVTVTAKARVKKVDQGFLVNLVPNPSFEVDTDGWALDGVFSRSNEDAYQGAYSIKLVAPDGFANLTTTNDESSGIPVVPNSSYRLSVYYKLTNNSGNNPIVRVRRDSAFGTELAAGFPSPNGSWTRLQFTVSVPADCNKVWIVVSNNGGDVIMFLDAFQLEPGTSANNYIDGSIPPARWTGSAHDSSTVLPLPHVQAKARVKKTGVTQTVQAKARVGNDLTVTVNVQAKAKVESFSQTIPKTYLIPNRKVKIDMGFFPEKRRVFEGYSGMFKVTRAQRRTTVHFEDELSRLADYKLSEGDLLIDVRTDRYIWDILDIIYEDEYTNIAKFESPESWTGGTSDTTNHRGGDGARALQSTGSNATMNMTLGSLDLSGYGSDDAITAFLFIDDIGKLASAKIKLGDSSLTNYWLYDIPLGDLITGWNELYIEKSAFIATGTPNWADLDKVQVEVDATASDTVNTIWDELRITNICRYPRRKMDVGLQFIPVAWYAANTALYEIKTACEAEGARFFADNEGSLNFWNRQHFNNNPEFQESKHQFQFNRMFDLEYPNDQGSIINKILVKLNPRKVVASAEEMWRYGFAPSIPAGATRVIWASFNDPAPTTVGGIIEPVATTDYLGNTAQDGTGSDKTAQLEILEFNRFTTGAKITIRNNDGGSVFLFMLRVRGTPAKTAADTADVKSSENEIRLENTTSIAKYGERPAGGLTIENKYLANEDDATTLAQSILDSNANPLDRVILKARAIPQLNLGDMITVVNEDTANSLLMRIMAMKLTMSEDGFDQEIHARSVTSVESLSYFTINESAIEGTDVISP